MSLDKFFASRDLGVVQRSSGWKIERSATDAEVVFITLNARDGERYRAMCLCAGYPNTPPSVAFVNDDGSKADPRAWPSGNQAFHEEVKPPPNSFLCMPLTREGLAHHPGWRDDPAAKAWNGARHTLMDIFNHLQRLLMSSNYLGRGV